MSGSRREGRRRSRRGTRHMWREVIIMLFEGDTVSMLWNGTTGSACRHRRAHRDRRSSTTDHAAEGRVWRKVESLVVTQRGEGIRRADRHGMRKRGSRRQGRQLAMERRGRTVRERDRSHHRVTLRRVPGRRRHHAHTGLEHLRRHAHAHVRSHATHGRRESPVVPVISAEAEMGRRWRSPPR